jgi:hypothetical protein
MWYSNLEKICISRHILHQHWYTCPIALPVRRNPQHRSLLTVVSANSVPPFHYLRFSNVFERISWPSCEHIYATNTSHCKLKTFIYEYPPQWVLLHTQKNYNNAALRYYTSQAKSPFWILEPASGYAYARLLHRLSWRLTVLLPSDTYRKRITSVTAVLLPSVV